MVIPLENEINNAAKHFHASIPFYFCNKLQALGLPGQGRGTRIGSRYPLTDASVPQRWEVRIFALQRPDVGQPRGLSVQKHGLESRSPRQHRREITSCLVGAPGKLQDDLAEDFATLEHRLGQRTFYEHAADLSTLLTRLKMRTRDAAREMAEAQQQTIRGAAEDLQRLPEWGELTQEEQSQLLSQLEGLTIQASQDLEGLKQLLRQGYVIQTQAGELKAQVMQLGHERHNERLRAEKERALHEGREKLSRTITVPALVNNVQQLETLIRKLQTLKDELPIYSEIEIRLVISE